MLRKLAAVLGVLLVLGVSTAAAQDNRTIDWQRYDVNIDNINTSTGQFDVTEAYDINFSGTFRFGTASIPTSQTTGIDNVQVTVGGQALQQSCSQQGGTFCAQNDSGNLSIQYYFPQSVTNQTEHIELSYTVHGGLLIYSGGDQLDWFAVAQDHSGFPIDSSTVTITMPAGYGPREGVDHVVTYGAPGDIQVNGTKIVATATRQIGGDEYFEVRVQYPHDPNAKAAPWQTDYDRQAQFENNVKPILTIVVIAVSLLIAIGGALFFYLMYQRKGRDPQIGPVPTYLSEAPSDLPPAVVGTLVDERADPRDAISTIIDLAHRGYLAIEETQNEGVFGIGRSSTFTFKRSDKPLDGLRPFELKMMNRLFSGGKLERTMDSLRASFYTVIAEVQGDLYTELVADEFFNTSPASTRMTWSVIAIAIIGLAVVLGFVLFPMLDTFSYALVLLPVAVGFVGVVALIIGPNMPAKTRKGAEEAAKWKAFYEYLNHLEKYAQVEEAAAQFEKYLPYAVAFGLDKSWIHRFSRVSSMPIPYWYYPTYIGPYRRGYMAGSPLVPFGGGNGGGLPGGLVHAGGGGASLDQMSGNLSGGLDSISNGLTHMLDSASAVMTSRPQSASSGSSGSWRSGGGGGFSGGFSGGGHGGGGGSRGFG